METGKNRYMQYNSGSREDEGIYGEAGVFIEPLPVLRSLYIFGAGHVAQAVAAIAGRYGFAVHLIDPREGLLDSIITEGIQKHCMAYDEAISAFDFDDKTFIVVSTHSHASDFGVTAACSLKPHAYLGMIGSKKKVEEAREVFRNKGLPEESIDSIDMPIGMPMDCETPGEIAISILARLIDIKNK
jgi:xanthine dehydrogenase accessory factor